MSESFPRDVPYRQPAPNPEPEPEPKPKPKPKPKQSAPVFFRKDHREQKKNPIVLALHAELPIVSAPSGPLFAPEFT